MVSERTKNGFRDVREDAELLASGRLPKNLVYKLKSPFPPQLRAKIAKAKGEGQKAFADVQNALQPTPPPTSATSTSPAKDIGKYALRGAAQVAAGIAGARLQSVIAGKIGKIAGPALGAVSKVQQMATLFTLGVQIAEELDPRKIEWPPRPGPAIDPVLLGASLAETAAKGAVMSLMTGIPVGCGIPPRFNPFRTLNDLKASLRFFDPTGGVRSGAGRAQTQTGFAIPRVNAQRGLLEDEIAYRLTLLAENVYAPMSQYCAQQNLGKLTILEGFRSENSGSSQHERGEAMDVTLPSVENLFQLAVWAADNLVYDQLILCHSDIGEGQSWIHVSFTPDSRRRQILTKTFNDTFVEGLIVYRPYTDPALLSADKTQAESLRQSADQMTQILAQRDAKLSPIGVNTSENVSGTGFAGGGGAKCTSNPSIPTGATTYDSSITQGYSTVIQNTLQAMFDEVVDGHRPWYEMAQEYNVDLMRELVRRVNLPEVGLNAKRGSRGDTSADAVAIKNPTGAKGYGSWEPDARVAVVDVILGHEGPNPSVAWIDQTDLCDSGGGFGG